MKLIVNNRRISTLVSLILSLGFIFLGLTSAFAQPATASKTNTSADPTNQTSSENIMDGVNAQRTGAYQTKGVHQLNSVLWKYENLFPKMSYSGGMMSTRKSASVLIDFNFSEPVIAHGLIYFKLSIGNSFLIALDAGTGKGVWKFEIEKGEISSPAVAGGMVFLGTDRGNFHALDARTGQEKWKFSDKDGYYAYFPPVIDGGTVYFGSPKGNLFAVDPNTGQTKWSFKTKGSLTASAVANDTIYVGGEKGVLFALDTKTGQEKWNFKAKGELGMPVFANGVVYFRTMEGNLYAVDANTGQQKWSTRLGKKIQTYFPITTVNVGAPLAFADGVIYFVDDSSLYAVDAERGEQKWKFDTKILCRSPIIADGTVYVGCMGDLYGVNAKGGHQELKIENKNVVFSSPAVADGAIYFVSDDGNFYAMR
ncbi:MAG: PQQ-binding-like beta-propeller repeat protein [Acidobacteriota bacterium]|nr:PQQ-binding-like beta-propeller repeat protein [Acidobacteriota bacterium]